MKPAFILTIVLIAFFLLLGKAPEVLTSKSVSKETCNTQISVADKQKCWDELFTSIFNESGIETAFLLVEELNNNDPEFALYCHDLTHALGWHAYELLAKGVDINFPPQTAFCGNGFYHGLTEILIQKKGAKEAARLCDSKKAQLTNVLYDACYHGIGHGALSQTAQDGNIWGDMQKMINAGLTQCKDASDQRNPKARCANGVFMELLDYRTKGKGNLELTSNKDYLLGCIDKRANCYTQLVEGVEEVIDKDTYSTSMMVTLAASTWNPSKTGQEEAVLICRSLESTFRIACIQGITLGLMLNEKPQMKYYDQAIDFCRSSILLEEEKDSCFLFLTKQAERMG